MSMCADACSMVSMCKCIALYSCIPYACISYACIFYACIFHACIFMYELYKVFSYICCVCIKSGDVSFNVCDFTFDTQLVLREFLS